MQCLFLLKTLIGLLDKIEVALSTKPTVKDWHKVSVLGVDLTKYRGKTSHFRLSIGRFGGENLHFYDILFHEPLAFTIFYT